ncbi:MAG: flippase [Anaerolineae bacterium]
MQGDPSVEGLAPLRLDEPHAVSPRRIVTNLGNSVISLIGAMGLGFIVSWLLARSMGDTVYGQYVFLLGIAGILTSFADLGLSQVMIREVARDRANAGRHAVSLISIRMIANGFVLVASLFLVQLDEAQRSHEVLALVVIVTMMITLLSDLIRSAFNGFERLELDLVTRIGERLITLIFIVLLVAGGITLDLAVAGMFAGAVIGLIITVITVLRWTPIHPLQFRRHELPIVLKAGLPIGLSIMVVSFYSRYDVLVLGVLRTSSEVAWFSVAYSLILVLVSLSFAASNTLFPVLSRLAHTGNMTEHAALFRLMLRYTLVGGLWAAGITFVMAVPFINLLYGPTYSPSAIALEILSIALIFIFPTHLMINMLFSLGRQKSVLASHVLSGIMLLFMDPILISLWGIQGAAVSNVIIEATIFCLMLVLITRSSGRVAAGTFLRPFAAAGIGAAVYAVLSIPDLPRALAAFSVFALALFVFKAMTYHDLHRLVLAISGKMGHSPNAV